MSHTMLQVLSLVSMITLPILCLYVIPLAVNRKPDGKLWASKGVVGLLADGYMIPSLVILMLSSVIPHWTEFVSSKVKVIAGVYSLLFIIQATIVKAFLGEEAK